MAANVDMSVISKYFCFPEKEVAKRLGICLTSLKKMCRQNGISRWPYRKIMSVSKKVQKTIDDIDQPKLKKEVSCLIHSKASKVDVSNLSSPTVSTDDDLWSCSSTLVTNSEGSGISSPCEDDLGMTAMLDEQNHTTLETLNRFCDNSADPQSLPLPTLLDVIGSLATCHRQDSIKFERTLSFPATISFGPQAPTGRLHPPSPSRPSVKPTIAIPPPCLLPTAHHPPTAAPLSDQDLINLLASCAGTPAAPTAAVGEMPRGCWQSSPTTTGNSSPTTHSRARPPLTPSNRGCDGGAAPGSGGGGGSDCPCDGALPLLLLRSGASDDDGGADDAAYGGGGSGRAGSEGEGGEEVEEEGGVLGRLAAAYCTS